HIIYWEVAHACWLTDCTRACLARKLPMTTGAWDHRTTLGIADAFHGMTVSIVQRAPVSGSAEPPAARRPAPSEVRRTTRIAPQRIAVVDDSPERRLSVAEQLAQDGFLVAELSPSDDVLGTILTAPPDLIVVHASMGDDRPLYICRTLRKSDCSRLVPI